MNDKGCEGVYKVKTRPKVSILWPYPQKDMLIKKIRLYFYLVLLFEFVLFVHVQVAVVDGRVLSCKEGRHLATQSSATQRFQCY